MSADVARKPRVLLTTEGTYPYVVGGVSTWCDILVTGLGGVDWQVLPITAGGLHRDLLFTLAPNVRLVGHVELWSESVHPWNPLSRGTTDHSSLPGDLVRGLLGWDSDPTALVEALAWCRDHPSRIRLVFRSKAGWQSFLDGLETVLAEQPKGTAPAPDIDVLQASELYQTLYWAARTAGFPTPSGAEAPDLVLVTAAGWSGIPAAVHAHRHGTPIVLAEHGVYVREAYLGAIRGAGTASSRWATSRLARGLARLSYAVADVVAPVTQANAAWEMAMGVEPSRIRTIYNGVLVPTHVPEPPRHKRVVSIGRVDALKDVKTMLRAAKAVLALEPDATFSHFGPVPVGQEPYMAECRALHTELGLGERFRFEGPTSEPYDEMGRADVALLTSISEGFPIAVLEAMACGRPVVATAVGGVAEAVSGCGFTAPPGDAEALAAGVVTLLRDPRLAAALGARGQARVARNFGQAACLEAYRALICELTHLDVATAKVPGETDLAVESAGPIDPVLAAQLVRLPDGPDLADGADGARSASSPPFEAVLQETVIVLPHDDREVHR